MITLSELKLLNATVIYQSNLPKESKLQLLEFVKKEATELQLKVLLLDGKIISNVDEVTEQIINDRFKANKKIAKIQKKYKMKAKVTKK
jgi:hypothetical protein